MRLDDAILEELERDGPGTVKEIGDRLAVRVQDALDRLIKAHKVSKAGFHGKGNVTYSRVPPPPIRLI